MNREVETAELHSHGRFVDALANELQRCRLFGREAAMLMVRDCGPNARPLVERSKVLKRLIRPVDQLAFYTDRIVEVLLPESGRKQAEDLARLWSDMQVLGEETVLAASLAVYPGSGRSSRELLHRCRQALQEVTPEQPLRVVGPSESPAVQQDATGTVVFKGAMLTVPDAGLDLRAHVRRYEADLIRAALRMTDGRRAEAARLLQLPARTLSRKIKAHNLEASR